MNHPMLVVVVDGRAHTIQTDAEWPICTIDGERRALGCPDEPMPEDWPDAAKAAPRGFQPDGLELNLQDAVETVVNAFVLEDKARE